MKRIYLVLAPAAVLAASSITAQSGIVCNGSYQRVGGAEISTPYCSDRNLAQVARSRGIKISDAEVRNNPNRKEEVCRMIGFLTSVRDACNTDSDSRSK